MRGFGAGTVADRAHAISRRTDGGDVAVPSAVEFLKDDGGTRTELELVLPDAFLPTEADAAAAAKQASGTDADTKATFWKSALETAPLT